MAGDSSLLYTNGSDSSNKTTAHRGSILLLIRSYEEARIVRVFAIILSINLVVIVLGIYCKRGHLLCHGP